MGEFSYTEREGHVLTVVLNRPERMNALHSPAHFELDQIFNDFEADPDLWVCILTGAGDRAFSAGNDLKFQAEGGTRDRPKSGFGGITERFDRTKPMIAAVNGVAMGGGFELALSCDMILATEASSFALPEIRAGTLADAATIKLPKRIPYHVAMDMLFTGRWMDCAEAHRWGLVNEVMSDGATLYERAWELARLLASGPPLVFAAIKEVAREAEAMKFQDAMNRVTKMQLPTVDTLYHSEDGQEGFRAFAEKRDPVWKGR